MSKNRSINLPCQTIRLLACIFFIGLNGCGSSNDVASLPEMGSTYPDGLPNILLILTDDQRADTLFAMPTIEKLANRGVKFTNAFVTTPMCGPVRASIHAGGIYAHKTGILTNASANLFDDTDTLATNLQKNGYKTGFVGKYMHRYKPGYIPPGWTRFVANNDGGMIKDWFNLKNITIGSSDSQSSQGEITKKLKQYITYFQRDQALEFIDIYGNSPFFLFLSTYAPHGPRIPAPEDMDKFSGYEFKVPKETDLSDKPIWVKKAANYRDFPWSGKTGNNKFRKTLRTLASVDRSINTIIHKLDQTGVLDKTVIIFTSDNGLLWGEHGLIDKGSPYDPAIRVPLIISIPGGKPAVNDNLVAMNLDIGATIFDIAKITKKSDGISLLPVLQSKPANLRNEFVLEAEGYLRWWNKFGFKSAGLGKWSGIRTMEWKYIKHPTGEKELYNLLADPDEMDNVIHDSSYREIKNQLDNTLGKIKVPET